MIQILNFCAPIFNSSLVCENYYSETVFIKGLQFIFN